MQNISWQSDVIVKAQMEIFLYLFRCVALLDTIYPVRILGSPSARKWARKDRLPVL